MPVWSVHTAGKIGEDGEVMKKMDTVSVICTLLLLFIKFFCKMLYKAAKSK